MPDKLEFDNEQQKATQDGEQKDKTVHGTPARSYMTGHRPKETFEQLVARANANSFFLPEVVDSKPKKRIAGGKKKLHRVAKKALDLTAKQLELLVEIARGRQFALAIGGVQYSVRKLKPGAWQITSLCKDSHEYSVTLDPPACTCPDCAFRDRECKHILALKELL